MSLSLGDRPILMAFTDLFLPKTPSAGRSLPRRPAVVTENAARLRARRN